MLLGASRPSVSVVIEDFQKRRILRAERGALVIGSREELLRVSCQLTLGGDGLNSRRSRSHEQAIGCACQKVLVHQRIEQRGAL